MITGHDGRSDGADGKAVNEIDDEEEELYQHPGSHIAQDIQVAHTPSAASGNLSSLTTQQTGACPTHRFEKAPSNERTAEIEQLSQDDIEIYLQNESVVASQSSSQEIRADSCCAGQETKKKKYN